MQAITHSIGSTRLTVNVAATAAAVLIGIAPHSARAICDVTCSNPDAVSEADLLTLTGIALGGEESACPDLAADGPVTVDDVTAAIDEQLNGCEPPPEPVCGNGDREGSEECDNGGQCFGTSKAGQHCESDADCGTGNGKCEAGVKGFWACTTDADCPDSRCVRCMPLGGDGCAANCTIETNFVFNLKSPESGSIVYANFPLAVTGLPLPLAGHQTMISGHENGNTLIPFVVKAADVKLDPINLLNFYCICVRAVALKTCGGTLTNKNGTLTPSCTPNYDTAPANCAALGLPPCAFVYGAGNSGVGVVGCDGLPLTDVSITQTRQGTDPGTPQLSFSGEGGPGSVIIVNSSTTSQVAGLCTAQSSAYGPDGKFCTSDDPAGPPLNLKGTPGTVPQTTGTASATFVHPLSVPANPNAPPLTKSTHGEPFVCLDGTIDPTQLGGVVSAIPFPPSPTLAADQVVISQFFAQ
jgi:hypothetical protein